MEFVQGKNDFHVSTERALEEIDAGWRDLPGVIVFGTHSFEDVPAKLELIRRAREEGIPFFGECGGLQLAVIEYARNVLGLEGADTTEIDPFAKDPVVTRLPSLRVGIFRVRDRMESFWHRFAVSDDYLLRLHKDWEITADASNVVAEMRLRGHPFFAGTQYHPSYNSSKENPHPILTQFLHACRTTADMRHR